MAIQVKKNELQRQGAAIHPGRIPFKANLVAAPTPDNSLAEAISRIAAALANSQADQRTAIMQALVINEQQLAMIVSSLKTGEQEYQNWNVNITRRDALGRIAEVQFRPANT